MQIHNNTLIAECSAYDFKEMLERKKVKSWLKSVSAFANTEGGSLFYGVDDDGEIVGLENPQADADFISETIKARLDPMPEVQLIPLEHEGHSLLEMKVKVGTLTSYYYYQDGTRTACVRVGNESVEYNSQQLLSLVLKGTHMAWDSLPTQVDANKHSFVILANTFREQTHQEWNEIDIYDDRVELVSPGAMLDGTPIQDRDIYKVPFMRRNPVIADVFTQLDYMKIRGSGLRKMRELTEKLPNFPQGKEPQYQTEATSFYTTFYNLNWSEDGRIPVEEVANRVNSTLEKYLVNEESSVKNFGDSQKPSVKPKRLGRTAQSIFDIIIPDSSISQDKMAKKISVSKRAIEMQIANLKAKGLLGREGADHGGYWRIIVNPQTEQ